MKLRITACNYYWHPQEVLTPVLCIGTQERDQLLILLPPSFFGGARVDGPLGSMGNSLKTVCTIL